MPYINLVSSSSRNVTFTQVRIVDINAPGEHAHMRPAIQLFLWITLSLVLFIAAIAVYKIYKTVSHLRLTGHDALTTPASLSDELPTTASSRSSLSSTLTTDTDATAVDHDQDGIVNIKSKEEKEEKAKPVPPSLILTSPSLSLKGVPISDFNFPLRGGMKPRSLPMSTTGTRPNPALLSPKFIAKERRRMRGREVFQSTTPPPRFSSRSQSRDSSVDDDDDEPLYKILERRRSTSASPPPSPLPIPLPTPESLAHAQEDSNSSPIRSNDYDEDDEDSFPLGLRALRLSTVSPISS
jgi:hypothetical protein